jgi:ubiquinone/menaquinone biosynthesis C-methylase UbiE
MVGGRRNIPELMDDLSVDEQSLERALVELSTINRLLGGDRVSRLGVRRILRSLPPDRPVTVLDVGSGGSDLLRALAPLGRQFEITALDLNPRAGDFAMKRGRPVTVVVGSAHALPFDNRSFDVAHVSLFLHHCTDDEARALLLNLSRIARHGIVINDLHRHGFAYIGISLLTRLFSRSALVRHDGPVSVLRGFLRSELAALLPARQQTPVSISWHWAFRWCVAISLKDPADGTPSL